MIGESNELGKEGVWSGRAGGRKAGTDGRGRQGQTWADCTVIDMGGRLGLFSVCQSKPREEEAAPADFWEGTSRLVGPEESVKPATENKYFSAEELRYYEELLADEEQRKSEVQAPRRWQAGEFLGQGSFGRVIFAANMDTGELFAVKQIPISGFSYETVHERIEEIQQEVDILSHLNHKNIVRYMGTSRDDQNLNIFLEYVAGGSIASLLSKYGKFNEALVRVYTRQIVEGLEYLHYHNIIHRDIKGANVLVNNEGVCKLADFGAAKKIYGLTDYTQFKSLRGTINWMAPEVMKQEGHGRHADIWSLGCTVLEMLTGKPPWHYKTNPVSDKQIQVLMHVGRSNEPPELPEELSLPAKDFILACLRRNPGDRPNVRQLLQHPFISGVQSTPSFPRISEDAVIDAFISSSTVFSTAYNRDDSVVVPATETIARGETIGIDIEESKVVSCETDLGSRNPNHNLTGPFGSIIPAEICRDIEKQKTQDEVVVLRRNPDETCKSVSDSYVSNSNSSSSGTGSAASNLQQILLSQSSLESQRTGDKKTEGQGYGRRGEGRQKEQHFAIVCVA